MRNFIFLPLSAVLFIPFINIEVKANTAYGYGMQWCQMVRSGMDPKVSVDLIGQHIANGVPPSNQGDPYAPWSPLNSTSGAIASGIASGLIEGLEARRRMSEIVPGFKATVEANCPDFWYSLSNYQFRNKKIKKRVCKFETVKGKRKRTCRKKTAEELAAERPSSIPIDPKEKSRFCKFNLYESDCKYYLDKKLKARFNSMPNQSQTIEQKLDEIQDLLDNGSINQKEYNVMRKKALGL